MLSVLLFSGLGIIVFLWLNVLLFLGWGILFCLFVFLCFCVLVFLGVVFGGVVFSVWSVAYCSCLLFLLWLDYCLVWSVWLCDCNYLDWCLPLMCWVVMLWFFRRGFLHVFLAWFFWVVFGFWLECWCGWGLVVLIVLGCFALIGYCFDWVLLVALLLLLTIFVITLAYCFCYCLLLFDYLFDYD